MSEAALVVGGSGPTGPLVVQGLLERFDRVAVLHSGRHEHDHGTEVEHLHADPRSREAIAGALAGKSFDVAVLQYGRLALLSSALADTTRHVVAIGGATAGLAPGTDLRWGAAGRPVLLDEASAIAVEGAGSPFGQKVAAAERHLFGLHAAGRFIATYLAYPVMYGPRQPVPHDWCVIRRIRDGRRNLFVADHGLKVESRIFSENAVAAVLRVIDDPSRAAGKKYFVTDEFAFDMRTRLAFLCTTLGFEGELIDAPYDVAWPCRPWWRFERDHSIVSGALIRADLGHLDVCSAEEATTRTVDWLLRHPPGAAQQSGLGDPFDYVREDETARAWRAVKRPDGPTSVDVGKRPLYRSTQWSARET